MSLNDRHGNLIRQSLQDNLLLPVLIVLLSLSVNVYAQGGAPVVPVEVTKARYAELVPRAWVAATVISRNDVSLSSEIEGRIVSLLEIGDTVTQGDIVARISDSKLPIRLDEAKADIAVNKAKLDFFEREAERMTRLASDNNVAKSKLDEVVAERDELRSELVMKQASLAQVIDSLDRTAVLAPFSGVIARRYAEPGEWAKIGDQLVRLVDIQSKDIQARVQHNSAALMKEGMTMMVTDGVKQTPAVLRALIPVGDDASRLYEIRLDFDEPTWLISHPVRVSVPAAAPKNALVVPRDALVVRGSTVKVFRILPDNFAELVLVTPGIVDGDLVEVIGNIKAGDEIVVRGNERLRPQQKVSIQ